MRGLLLAIVAVVLTSLAPAALFSEAKQNLASNSVSESQPKFVKRRPEIQVEGPPDYKPVDKRVYFIVANHCERCQFELARLNRPGGDFEAMRAAGWKIGSGPGNQIQIIDQETIPDLIRELNVREFPTVACVIDGKIVRSFKSGCTTPLDVWTFGWLYKGRNERPGAMIPEPARVESTGSYRLRGNHWSVDGDWNPPKATVVNHLRSPVHAYGIAANWQIENWSYEELRSLHDDLHEREMGSSAGFTSQPASRGADDLSANRKLKGG